MTYKKKILVFFSRKGTPNFARQWWVMTAFDQAG